MEQTKQSSAINPTHERIRAAALDLFASRGFHGTGIRDIAKLADVSTANLYHYTGSKDRLLLQIMEGALEKLLEAAREIHLREDDPRRRIEQLVRMHVITHALSPKASSVVDDQFIYLEGEQREQIVSMRDEYEEFYSTAISGGVESGSFKVPQQSSARLGLLEMLSGVARWYSPKGKMGPAELAEIHVTLSLSLLGADNSEPITQLGYVSELIESIWSVKIH
jgi:AcrR family transcriptional regulator